MLYLQIASPKSSVLNFLDSNSFEVIISIFQRTEKVPDMERLRLCSGGYIFIHDYNSRFKGVREAIKRYEIDNGIRLAKVPIPDADGSVVLAK